MLLGDIVQSESRFLNAKDLIAAPLTVTIRQFVNCNVAAEDKPQDMKPCLSFIEDVKPCTLNKTRLDDLQLALGLTATDDHTQAVGRKIVLYHDPRVEYMGKRVGGIAIRMDETADPVSIPLGPLKPAAENEQTLHAQAAAANPGPADNQKQLPGSLPEFDDDIPF